MEYMGCLSSEVGFAMTIFAIVRWELDLFRVVSWEIDAVAGDDLPNPPLAQTP